MTNKTGPAQQPGQPTQLTAAEAVELYQLIRAYGAAKFSYGLASGVHGNSPQTDDAQELCDVARDAVFAWEMKHGLTVAAFDEATKEARDEVTA